MLKSIVSDLNIYGEFIVKQQYENSPMDKKSSTANLNQLSRALSYNEIDEKQIARSKYLEFFDKLWTTVLDGLSSMPISMRMLLYSYTASIKDDEILKITMTDVLIGKWWQSYITHPDEHGIIQKNELNERYDDSSSYVIGVN